MGRIEIELPEGASSLMVQYEKIAEREEVIGKDITEIIQDNMEYDHEVSVLEQKNVILNAEEGVYQIQISGDDTFQFEPVIVSMPMWDEETQKMDYEIEVIPKYSRNIKVPKTGDDNSPTFYASLLIISVIFVVFLSCHKRWKCGRMSFKNSKRRRT